MKKSLLCLYIPVCIFFGYAANLQSKETLFSVIKTGRISSNHFAEIVKDSKGITYTASFFKDEEGADRVFFAGMHKYGTINPVSGGLILGRATCITIDGSNKVTIAGFARDRLIFGNKGLAVSEDFQGNFMYIANFDNYPNMESAEIFEYPAIPFNIHKNKDGSMLMAGIMGKELRIHDAELIMESNADGTFLAYFNPEGKCRWIKEFPGQILRIKSSPAGTFYLTGEFMGTLKFGDYSLETTGDMDTDGFIISVAADGTFNWIKQFGAAGNLKSGYRTVERGNDISFRNNGNILAASLIYRSGNSEAPDLAIMEFDNFGELVSEKIIARNVNHSIVTFTGNNKDKFWLTGVAANGTEIENEALEFPGGINSFVFELDGEFNIKNKIFPGHGPNMLFRSSYYRDGVVSFSGHFQELLKIKNNQLKNDGTHELFMYSLEE